MSKKRHREKININEQLIEIFDDLGHVDEEIRLKAAQRLVQEFGPTSKVCDDAQQLHILRRLLRGLCSGRNAARIGFSVALTELLTQARQLQGNASAFWSDQENLVRLLREQTSVAAGADGQVCIKMHAMETRGIS